MCACTRVCVCVCDVQLSAAAAAHDSFLVEADGESVRVCVMSRQMASVCVHARVSVCVTSSCQQLQQRAI